MKITSDDFTSLFDTSMEWGREWEIQSDRFSPDVSYDWKRAYWYESYANLMIARTYLSQEGYECQMSSDETGGWVILTDYEFDREVASV